MQFRNDHQAHPRSAALRLAAGVAAIALGAVGWRPGAADASPLQTLENPGGGIIVYGQVDGARSEPQAMGIVLRSLHQQNGDRPQVGRVFQVRGTDSRAVFLTLTKRTQDNRRIAGMLIVAKSADHVEAALLSDDAARFGTTVNPMLRKLLTVWHPAGVHETQQGSAPGPAEPLRQYVLPDRSAAVSLPQDWQLDPQSGGGTIGAKGKHGELVALGMAFLAADPNNPMARQSMQFARTPMGRNSSYARMLYYPFAGDPAQLFVSLIQHQRELNGQQPARIEVKSAEPAAGAGRCIHLTGIAEDGSDGVGPREFNTIFCSGRPDNTGTYMNLAYHTAVPVALAAKERATMGAILQSFRVDNARVQGQAAAIAAPAIEQIHAIGRAAAERSASMNETYDRYNAGVRERWDSQDKRNQAFSNYLLDQSVIRDNENNAHGTLWNQAAESLVHSNPDRFEYVETPNYWKGVDY